MTTFNEMIAGRRLAELGADLLAYRATLVTMIETGIEAVSGMRLHDITPEGPLGLQLTVIDTLLALPRDLTHLRQPGTSSRSLSVASTPEERELIRRETMKTLGWRDQTTSGKNSRRRNKNKRKKARQA